MLDQGEQCEGGTTLTCTQATMGARPNGVVVCTNCYIDPSGCAPQYNTPPGPGPGPSGGAAGNGGQLGNPPPIGGAPSAGGAQPVGNGGASPAPAGSKDPVVPPITQTCPNFTNGTITFMGLAGIRIVAGAKPAGPTAPMLFYWHGTGGQSSEYAALTAVSQGVISEGGVIVSFQGTTGGDLQRSGTSVFGPGDYKLADELFACAVRDHNIDPRRVYTAGCSAGGLFAVSMAVERSAYVAAAGPNSGGMISTTLPWQNDHTPALMTVHGRMGADVVIVDFANTSATADATFKARGGFVIDCDTGGGHCGGNGLSPDIWKFFKAHPFGVDPEPYAGGLPAGFSSMCQIK